MKTPSDAPPTPDATFLFLFHLAMKRNMSRERVVAEVGFSLT